METIILLTILLDSLELLILGSRNPSPAIFSQHLWRGVFPLTGSKGQVKTVQFSLLKRWDSEVSLFLRKTANFISIHERKPEFLIVPQTLP